MSRALRVAVAAVVCAISGYVAETAGSPARPRSAEVAICLEHRRQALLDARAISDPHRWLAAIEAIPACK